MLSVDKSGGCDKKLYVRVDNLVLQLLSLCSHQLKNFRNNTNRAIKSLTEAFSLEVKDRIKAGTLLELPHAPISMKHWDFAPCYGFNDYAYNDKFERVIETVTNASDDVVVL
jgi:hypothetical protein